MNSLIPTIKKALGKNTIMRETNTLEPLVKSKFMMKNTTLNEKNKEDYIKKNPNRTSIKAKFLYKNGKFVEYIVDNEKTTVANMMNRICPKIKENIVEVSKLRKPKMKYYDFRLNLERYKPNHPKRFPENKDPSIYDFEFIYHRKTLPLNSYMNNINLNNPIYVCDSEFNIQSYQTRMHASMIANIKNFAPIYNYKETKELGFRVHTHTENKIRTITSRIYENLFIKTRNSNTNIFQFLLNSSNTLNLDRGIKEEKIDEIMEKRAQYETKNEGLLEKFAKNQKNMLVNLWKMEEINYQFMPGHVIKPLNSKEKPNYFTWTGNFQQGSFINDDVYTLKDYKRSFYGNEALYNPIKNISYTFKNEIRETAEKTAALNKEEYKKINNEKSFTENDLNITIENLKSLIKKIRKPAVSPKLDRGVCLFNKYPNLSEYIYYDKKTCPNVGLAKINTKFLDSPLLNYYKKVDESIYDEDINNLKKEVISQQNEIFENEMQKLNSRKNLLKTKQENEYSLTKKLCLEVEVYRRFVDLLINKSKKLRFDYYIEPYLIEDIFDSFDSLRKASRTREGLKQRQQMGVYYFNDYAIFTMYTPTDQPYQIEMPKISYLDCSRIYNLACDSNGKPDVAQDFVEFNRLLQIINTVNLSELDEIKLKYFKTYCQL